MGMFMLCYVRLKEPMLFQNICSDASRGEMSSQIEKKKCHSPKAEYLNS